MIILAIAVVVQAVIVTCIAGIIYKVFWTVIDFIRMFLYYKCGMKEIFTFEEMISYGIIEPNTVAPEVEVLDRENLSHEEFWDNMNTTLDIQCKQSEHNPDEILFQGRVKRRR